jgi:hypothetical protein
VGSDLLMAHAQKLDIRAAVEGVQNLDIAGTYHAEDIFHPFQAEGLDDSLSG